MFAKRGLYALTSIAVLFCLFACLLVGRLDGWCFGLCRFFFFFFFFFFFVFFCSAASQEGG